MTSILPPHRRVRVLTVGIAAAVSAYALFLLLAEPLRSFAATSANSVITVNVTSTLALTCDSAVTFGSIAPGGDTGTYDSSKDITCTPITNNSAGYQLKWRITTGSGGMFGTGHLVNQYGTNGQGDTIRALTPAVASTTETFTSVSAGDSRWAARLSSTSTTTTGGPSGGWGTDSSSEKYLNVATGSTVTIANRTTETSLAGDTENVMFRAIISATKNQPTGAYKTRIDFTVTDN